ncbi:MAG TPA: 6-phosphogluconolactonase [Candidatus Limnocylindria bacterium]|nr:6-phosphogluconolactonase [Candidatus Limnocylindria bacterium]
MNALRTLQVTTFETHEALSQAAAQEVIAAVRRKPDALLCLATGNTPTRTYELLANAAQFAPDLFQRVRVLKLDEWGGLEMSDPGTSETYMRQHVLGPLRIDDSRYFGFNSNPGDPEAECARYRNWLTANGPVDVSILGLGVNGHVALNEPAAALKPFAHVAQLAPTSLHHSMLTGRCPTYGLTPGIADLLSARRILFLVSGAPKREPLQRLLQPQIAPQFPASFLWLHTNAVVMCEREARG